MPQRAFITGITGQDGSYLTELLISKGYEVHGLVRPSSLKRKGSLKNLNISPAKRKKLLHIHSGDLSDSKRLTQIFHKIQPHEVYHLGGQSGVAGSFDHPEYTFEVNAASTLCLLECVRKSRQKVRFYHASSSDIFGCPEVAFQNEATPVKPISPYACSKAAGHFLTACYRKNYGVFACNGILFSHESPRRTENFVSKKIARGVAAIKKGKQKKLGLGNLNIHRDWGYAPEYVEAMWRMLQCRQPDDYVVATGRSHSVREFVELAFKQVGLNWKKYVKLDASQKRLSEVGTLVGDSSRIRKKLGWKPRMKFPDLVRLMVQAEM